MDPEEWDKDPTVNYHGGDPNSAEAWDSVKGITGRLRRRVYRLIAEAPDGLTSDEAEVITGLPHQTCSARFTELKRDGLIVSFSRRQTRSGVPAAVYVPTPPPKPLIDVLAPDDGRLF